MVPGSTWPMQPSSLRRSKGCTRPQNSLEPALVLRRFSASSTVTADASGPKARSAAAPLSILRCRRDHWLEGGPTGPGTRGNDMGKVILLVEDNASDEKLTILAFKKCGVTNDVVVMRDGA